MHLSQNIIVVSHILGLSSMSPRGVSDAGNVGSNRTIPIEPGPRRKEASTLRDVPAVLDHPAAKARGARSDIAQDDNPRWALLMAFAWLDSVLVRALNPAILFLVGPGEANSVLLAHGELGDLFEKPFAWEAHSRIHDTRVGVRQRRSSRLSDQTKPWLRERRRDPSRYGVLELVCTSVRLACNSKSTICMCLRPRIGIVP
ncbi:hypothetical protein LZ30DRAFT_242157 [Colletotrichum cereale]|nr:hypothetical protein LZ30DRAFT_242157 [Colletotrichum cereale]